MNNCICSKCIKDSILKRFVVNNGKNGKCSLCGKLRSNVIEIANREFQNRMKAAIRYTYSEALYNSHWGGENHWINLLGRENEIFIYPIEESEDDEVNSLYWEMCDVLGHVSDYSKDVSLYFGGGRTDAFILPIMGNGEVTGYVYIVETVLK